MLRPSPNHGTQRLPNDENDDIINTCCYRLLVTCIELGTTDFLYRCVMHDMARSLVPVLIYICIVIVQCVTTIFAIIHFTFFVIMLQYKSSIYDNSHRVTFAACLVILLSYHSRSLMTTTNLCCNI